MDSSDAKSHLGYGLDWVGQVGRDGQRGKSDSLELQSGNQKQQ